MFTNFSNVGYRRIAVIRHESGAEVIFCCDAYIDGRGGDESKRYRFSGKAVRGHRSAGGCRIGSALRHRSNTTDAEEAETARQRLRR